MFFISFDICIIHCLCNAPKYGKVRKSQKIYTTLALYMHIYIYMYIYTYNVEDKKTTILNSKDNIMSFCTEVA